MRNSGHVAACVCFAILTQFGLARVSLAQESVKELTAALRGKDSSARLAAIDSLGNLGAAAKPAVPDLAKLLASGKEESKWRIGRSLGSIGADAKSAVPALVKALGDESPRVRAYSAYALGRIGDESAIDGLIKTALDEDVLVRRACFRALRQIDAPIEKTLPIIIAVLDRADTSVILPALHTLAEQGEEAVPRLRAALKHDKACYWACIVLADIGPDAAAAVPDIRAVLNHADPDVRLQALLTLGEIGKASAPAVPEIIERLSNDSFDHVRVSAAYALAMINPEGGVADKALKSLLESDHEMLQLVSAWALAKMNPNNKDLTAQAIELIVNGLKSDDDNVQSASARALVELEGPTEIVAPALVAALHDDNPAVVGNALDALAAQGPRALPGIGRALANPALRGFAVRILYRMGPEAAPAVPALLKAIQAASDDPKFLREAHFALGAIGPGAKAGIGQLVEALSIDNIEVQGSAMYVLGKIGTDAGEAVPALVKVFQGDDELLKRVAIWALLKIRPDNQQLARRAVPFMIKALESEREVARIEAALMLGEIGDAARPSAIGPLKKLLEDPSDAVRKAAMTALEKLN